MANGMRRLVAEFLMDPVERMSLLILAFSARRKTSSELYVEGSKNDVGKAEAITISTTEYFLWTFLPKAQMSPGRVLSSQR
jgi:hypothetical protein